MQSSTNRKRSNKMTSPFDNKKLQLMTKTLPGGSFPPNLKSDMYKGNPQLFVLTGNKKGEGPTYVRAGLEHKTAGLLCQVIETVADSVINEYTTGHKHPDSGQQTIISIECKAGKERETVSKVVVGKQADNKIFISLLDVKDSSVPVIQFIFGADLFHPIEVTGSESLNSSISAMAAKEWATRTREYWYVYSITNPEEAPKPQQGGYNNNSGGNSYDNGGSHGGGDAALPWNN